MQPGHDRQVGAIVLAAGLSSRMGRNKLLLEVGGQPLLRRAVSSALDAGLAPVLVVLGHEAERAQAALNGLACTTVFNPDFARGIETSLRAGAQALPEGLAAALVMLADMPLVSPQMLRALAERFRDGTAPLVLSVYGPERVVAPPIVYGSALFGGLLALDGEGAGKRLIARHRSDAAEQEWPAQALLDTDLPEELERVRALLDAAPSPLDPQD